MQIGAPSNPRLKLIGEIEWIAANGFDFIDLALEAPGASLENTDWDAVRAALASTGLGVVCRAAADLPLENPSPAIRQAALDELRRSLDVAQRLGATLCTTSFRGWPAHLSEAQGYEYYRQLYAILLKHGADGGVQVALENSPQNEHQLKWFREIYQRLPTLKLAYNAAHGNLQTVQSMTREYLFALADRLAHVRVSDNDGQQNGHLPFGAPVRGGLDWPRELRTLRSFRYDGSITVEILGDRRWLVACGALLREWWQGAE